MKKSFFISAVKHMERSRVFCIYKCPVLSVNEVRMSGTGSQSDATGGESEDHTSPNRRSHFPKPKITLPKTEDLTSQTLYKPGEMLTVEPLLFFWRAWKLSSQHPGTLAPGYPMCSSGLERQLHSCTQIHKETDMNIHTQQ